MLKKLLRYDLKPIFKYWWIAAITTFVTSLLGGGCITILRADPEPPGGIAALAIAGLVLIIICNAAFVFLTEILIYLRYYRNFFTDEGYLTFTLPVKRTTLINSKLWMNMIAMTATGLVLFVNVCGMLAIGFQAKFWEEFWKIWQEAWNVLGFYLPLYLIEGVLILLGMILLSALIIYCCLSFSAMVVKKARVFCAIALIYGVTGAFSFVFQVFNTLAMSNAFPYFTRLSEETGKLFLAIALLLILLLIGMFSTLAYLLQYRMLDRKLNLS